MIKFRNSVKMLFSLTLMLSLIVGCTSGNTATEQKENGSTALQSSDDPFKEHIEISLATWDIDTLLQKAGEDKIYQDLLKKFNISIKPVNVSWDDYAQKYQLWSASGQLPDIFQTDAIGTQYYKKWVTQNVVKALPEDMSAYPNLAKYFEAPDIAGLNEEGKFYNIPRRMFPDIKWSVLDRTVMYRWDLAKEAGITKEPDTYEEFNAMLKAIIDKDPEQKKISGLTASTPKFIGGFFWLYGNPVATSDGSGSDFKWIKEDGKFIPAVFSKNALPAIENMRKMYENNLIDKDIALQKPDAAYDKFVSGKSAALLAGGGFLGMDSNIYEKRWKTAYPDKDFTESVKVLKPLIGPDGNRYHSMFKTYWSESYISANVNDKKMDRILRMYDYILSPEGKDLLTYGIKDVDYKVENGKKVSIGDKTLLEKYPAKGIFAGLASLDTSDAYNMDNPTIGNEKIRQEAVDFINWSLENTNTPDYDIRLTYMSTPTKDKFTIFDHDDLLKIMLSTEPVDKMWTDIVNGYKAKGLDQMIEEVNAKAKEEGIE
ncbi:extracellular solute-binding protein [Paenibacillus sp. Marseille-Q4541]|uniref:extracellular solute-binding protein n=1 Tax=Paenibacillus sp. Marseille-Q4541 TaxID=2831522 RepID=UPI001BA6342A|nr:extracellular solute-binding protein [Paenibacillus sp. Marseille-Q4541]